MKQHIFSDRQLAKIYAHYVYRNTRIEDFRAEGRCLDDSLYKKMYDVVRTKVHVIDQYSRYLYLLDCGEDIVTELQKLPHDIAMPVSRFIMEILFNSRMGHDWDEPVPLDELPAGQGAASYILAGKFKECCKNKAVLSDKTMCDINKDVCNRIYTLILNGLL